MPDTFLESAHVTPTHLPFGRQCGIKGHAQDIDAFDFMIGVLTKPRGYRSHDEPLQLQWLTLRLGPGTKLHGFDTGLEVGVAKTTGVLPMSEAIALLQAGPNCGPPNSVVPSAVTGNELVQVLQMRLLSVQFMRATYGPAATTSELAERVLGLIQV